MVTSQLKIDNNIIKMKVGHHIIYAYCAEARPKQESDCTIDHDKSKIGRNCCSGVPQVCTFARVVVCILLMSMILFPLLWLT